MESASVTLKQQNHGKAYQNKIGNVDFMGLLYDSTDIQFKKQGVGICT